MALTGKELTPRDELFVEAYFTNNLIATAAYKEVFGEGKDPANSRFLAHRLLQKPLIKKAIRDRLDDMKDLISREDLVYTLKYKMDEYLVKGDDKNFFKAVEMLIKILGLGTINVEANVNHNVKLIIPGMPDIEDTNTIDIS